MVKVAGFSQELLVGIRDNAHIYRAVRDEDNLPVLLYICPPGDLSREVKLQQLFGLIHKLEHDGIVRAESMTRSGQSLVVITEHFKSESLGAFLEHHSLDREGALKIAIQLAGALSNIHANRIIHRALRPEHIRIDPDTLKVKITSFEYAIPANRERKLWGKSELSEEDLPYISPEQTGRMGREIDFRSDLYALGITFYRLAVGVLPFVAESNKRDPMEMIHKHLASAVVPPIEKRAEIGETFSSIILKLLEKDPQRRYQSARGLLEDLLKCQAGEEGFELGREEIPETLLLPSTLFGRKSELEQLRKRFNYVADGHAEIIYLTGSPGVGKTSLVMEFAKQAKDQGCFFVKGKYDRYQRTSPFSAILVAFESWVGQILTGSDEDLLYWKSRLNESLGHIGQVMVDLVPNLKWVIGEQEPVPKLGPNENQNRVKLALVRFAMAIAQPQNPLMLFLDDLQWADPASLGYLETLLMLRQEVSLMLVVSFREEDDCDSSAFHSLQSRLNSQGKKVCIIDVPSWRTEDTNAFIALTLSKKPTETATLTEMVRQKTGNNPLFVRQFLMHTYGLGLIRFVRGEGWSWDEEAIQQAGIPDDIVGMMTDKIATLPHVASQVMRLGACFGNKFSSDALFAVISMSEGEAAAGLHTLTIEGLLSNTGNVYYFSHDRIYEAALNLLSKKERENLHLQIGRSLLQRENNEDSAFDITNHLNRCFHLLETSMEREQLARLNLLAGKHSAAAGSYEEAVKHMTAGIEQMEGASWESHYKLLFGLKIGLAESLFLNGEFQKAKTQFEGLLKVPLEIRDKAKVVALMVVLSYRIGNSEESIKVGVEGLAELGMDVSFRPSDLEIFSQLIRTRWHFARKKESELLNGKMCDDPIFLAQMRILIELVVPAYFSNSRLSVYLILMMMRLLLKKGLHSNAPLIYAMFSLILGNAWGTNRDRFRLANIALTLDERIGDRRFSPRVHFLVNCHVHPWIKPMAECIEPLEEVTQHALEVGDHQYAVFARVEHLVFLWVSGENMVRIQSEARTARGFVSQLGYEHIASAVERVGWMAAYMRGDQDKVPSFKNNDPFGLKILYKSSTRISYFYCAPFAVFCLFSMGCYEEAYEIGRRVLDRIRNVVPFSRQIVEITFYLAMTAANLYPTAPKSRRRSLRQELVKATKQLEVWCKSGPANHRAQYLILEAEQARIDGSEKVYFNYIKAVGHARKHAFIHIEALVHERMGTYALGNGWEEEAGHHFSTALNQYMKWGAQGKVVRFKEMYGTYLQTSGEVVETADVVEEQRRILSKGTLDLSTVVESSLAISQEMDMEMVLERVMASAVENAGAERGLLLLKGEEGQLWLEAEGTLNGFLRLPRLEPVGTDGELAMTVVRYVQRTSETVVLREAFKQGLFQDDPYISETHTRSLLVMPILTQSKFVGILYLENNLVDNAFTHERTEVLRVITAQAAIALENARLYDELNLFTRQLEQRVEERTAELSEANTNLQREVEERTKAEKRMRDLQSKLVETARKAGMSEVAVGVLHNVGNVLNSVTISTTVLAENAKNTQLGQLERVVNLLTDNKDDLAGFFSDSKKAAYLHGFLEKVYNLLAKEREKNVEEIKKLTKNLSHAIEVIRAQQAQANVKAVTEPLIPSELFEEALRVNQESIESAAIDVVKEFEALPRSLVDRHKVLQILINLVKNAAQSMRDAGGESVLTLRCSHDENSNTVFEVLDTGLGIKSEHLNRVFSYGFTTKADGNGFGLHNAANAATEMGGQLKVNSEGEGRGARFSLTLPLEEHQALIRSSDTGVEREQEVDPAAAG